jgi:hypothetical protein
VIEVTLDFQHLLQLLRRRADDPSVVGLIGPDPSKINRNEYYGSVEFQDQGVEVVLKEAPWVMPPDDSLNPKDLFVAGFHFHRQGHDGYDEYQGQFPGGVAFSDNEMVVRHKLGEPSASGGGGISRVLKRPLAHWIQYKIDDSLLRFQLDADGKVDLVTLFVEAPALDRWTE